MPAIDIDRDAARQAAQRELAKAVYPKESPTRRLHEWVHELLYRLVGRYAYERRAWARHHDERSFQGRRGRQHRPRPRTGVHATRVNLRK
jgi:hypothetical protein